MTSDCGNNMLMHSPKSNDLSSMSHKKTKNKNQPVDLKSLSALKGTLLTESFLNLQFSPKIYLIVSRVSLWACDNYKICASQ